jgi:hypothetical protein
MTTTMRGVKLSNEYAKLLGPLYTGMPKAVIAAIAVSFANRINEGVFDGVECLIADEWQALYENGIVPQRPPSELRYKFAGSSRDKQEPQP